MDNAGLRTLIAEARTLVKLCDHALDVGDYFALADMAMEAQKRTARLNELAKVAAILRARTAQKKGLPLKK